MSTRLDDVTDGHIWRVKRERARTRSETMFIAKSPKKPQMLLLVLLGEVISILGYLRF